MRPVAFLGALVLGWAVSAAAQDPPSLFQLPVDCDMQEICSVQLYVDIDPTEGAMDYACGHLSYNGNTGMDIRVRDLADMERGVPVVAAAPGVVLRVRDGMEDVSVTEIGVEALEGRFAGNGVFIDHGNGWTTQYSHLRKDSVQVKAGDEVDTGTVLGLIGLSGRTSFPHVEFIVRYQDEIVDPFVGRIPDFECDRPRRPLWSVQALAAMPYRPAWIVSAGFADEAVRTEKIRRGAYDLKTLPDDAAVLSFWIHYTNVFAGDSFVLTIYAPDGGVLMQHADRVDKTQYSYYAFSGLRRPSEGWPAGTYTGTFSLSREGREILLDERTIEVQ